MRWPLGPQVPLLVPLSDRPSRLKPTQVRGSARTLVAYGPCDPPAPILPSQVTVPAEGVCRPGAGCEVVSVRNLPCVSVLFGFPRPGLEAVGAELCGRGHGGCPVQMPYGEGLADR